MSKKAINIISGCISIIIAIGFFCGTFNLNTLMNSNTGPEFFPRIACTIVFIFGLLMAADSILKKQDENEMVPVVEDKSRFVMTIILIASYALLVNILGFILTSILYLMAQMEVLAPEGEKKYTLHGIIAVTASLIIFYVFKVILQMNIPQGILF